MRESRQTLMEELRKSSFEINTQEQQEKQENLDSFRGPDQEKKLQGAGKKSAKKKKDLKEIREDINKRMPMRLGMVNDREVPGENGDPALREIERVLDKAAGDTGRAALYYKVRNAIALYRNETDENAKLNMLLAVRESAFNYLLEKKGKALTRKRVCGDIIRLVDAYAAQKQVSKERDLNGLIEQEIISDEKLDQEIRLAGKLTVKGTEEFKGNFEKRRQAFRKKRADVKLAGEFRRAFEENNQRALRYLDTVRNEYNVVNNTRNEAYDDAVSRVVSGYMNLDRLNVPVVGRDMENLQNIWDPQAQKQFRAKSMMVRLSVSDQDTKERLTAKGHMLEGIMAHILRWNPEDFAFEKPEDFLNTEKGSQSQKEVFLDLCNKLKVANNADALLNELVYMKENHLYTPNFDENMLKEIKARIKFYQGISKEYSDRLLMMESPYYALLMEEDTKDYDTQFKLLSLVQDKKVEGVNGKKSVGEKFKDYLSAVFRRNKRLKSGKKTGGTFTINTDAVKLLEWYRKKARASTENVDGLVEEYTDKIIRLLGADNSNYDAPWAPKNNIKAKEE